MFLLFLGILVETWIQIPTLAEVCTRSGSLASLSPTLCLISLEGLQVQLHDGAGTLRAFFFHPHPKTFEEVSLERTVLPK